MGGICMSSKEKEKMKVAINLSETQTLYIHSVELEALPDVVILNFIQKLPSKNDEVNARLVGRYAITWQHFIHLVRLFNRVVEKEKDNVVEFFNKSLKNLIENQ